MKVFYCVTSSGIFIESRQKDMKNTWLKDVDYIFASDVNDDDNVLVYKNRDYYSNEHKQINAIKYLLTNKSRYDWYMFCDDDTYVNKNNLNKYLMNINSNIDSFGCILNKDSDPPNPIWGRYGSNFQYYSGGAGFLIRKDLLEKISKKDVESTGFADVSFGLLLKEYILNNNENMNHNNYIFLNHDIKRIKSSITYHYIVSKMVYDLHDILIT